MGGAVDEIHFILKAGAATADDGYAQGSVLLAALLFQQAGEAIGCVVQHADETFISGAVLDFGWGAHDCDTIASNRGSVKKELRGSNGGSEFRVFDLMLIRFLVR